MTLELRHPFGPRLTVERHRLDNGLQVVLLPDHSAPVVAYQTWFRVGSRHEAPGQTGIAHLFEHLMFNQTETLAAGELDRLFEAVGGETNAATWVDWTYYRDSVPAAQLPLAVRLEAERMHRLVLEREQVESEIEVVLNERRFRVDDDVEGFLAEELYRLAFTRHPYGHPTLGWREDVAGITPADARAFYRRFYAPNNATIVVVGDIDPPTTLELLGRHYGALRPATVSFPELTPEPPQRGERRARFAKPVAADRALFAWRSPPQADPDWVPLLVANEILCGGPSARLFRELVVAREAVTTVEGTLAPFHDPGLLEVFVGMKRGHAAAEAEAAIDEAIDRLATELVEPAELAKAKNRLETELWSELDTADGKAEALGHYQTTTGDSRLLFEVARHVDAVTALELRRVVATYLGKDSRTLVVAEPSGEPPLDEDEDDDVEDDDAAKELGS
jgi:zinc protease